jgi:hypothetical protein
MVGTAAAVLFSVGCQSQKTELAPDFSGDLQAVADGKSDSINPKRLNVVGSLDYGQSATADYTGASKYLAFKFGGQPGDQVVIDVSSQDGDAYAWLTDDAGKVIAQNDDSGDSTNSHIEATMPGNKNPDIITYYIVFKDYYSNPASFTVALATKACFDNIGCMVGSHWDSTKCTCVADQQTCGGIANLQCPGGQKCVDNPNDNCDPSNGGADCGGICVACFDNVACLVGHHWSQYRCGCVSDTCFENVFCTGTSHWSQPDCTCVPN